MSPGWLLDYDLQMFERFTERARAVIFDARSAVSQFGSSAVEPEHILFGVLDEGNSLGCRILAELGGDLDEVRSDILGRLTARGKIPESDEVPFSASSERVLRYAVEEADLLLHDFTGTDHLLLGLLREEHGVAAEVLTARGLGIETVRGAIVEMRSRGERLEMPGPPPFPANTYQWPSIPFVPSRTVHILYSGMRSPEQPVANYTGTTFSAYGFTLPDVIVRAWDGIRWHVDIPPGLSDGTRFDFLMVLPQQETIAACYGLLRSAIREHFGLNVTSETRMRDVFVLTKTNAYGQMLRRYPDPEPGTGSALVAFSDSMGRSKDTPMFPLDRFAVHSVPFLCLVNWFEEIFGGHVIDETGLPGIYGFELKQRVNTPDALIQLLKDEAGLILRRERREMPTLVVRQRSAQVADLR